MTVDNADRGWNGSVGVVTKLIRRAPFDPHDSTAFVCGPEIMMRFTGQAARSTRGVPADRHLRLDGAQHEVRHRLLRPLPVRAAVHLQGRPGVPLRRRLAALMQVREV